MQNAFDQIASSYDETFTYTEIGKKQRNIVWDYLKRTLPADTQLDILELNCGTGEDALFLANIGHSVTATDASEEMLNITNEGWFGESALYQKVAASVFRAVENRISLARATNTGISCFINPHGEVYARVTKGKKETFVDGFLTRDLTLSDAKTFYTRYGNIFAYVDLITVMVVIVLSLIVGNKK